ncbi:MAG: acyl-CoA reductase [Saprospiraceae bacterium]|uniref:Acyl-CoA reductase n=1 Tax=Candidatus Opimibacter skivensis TaxID=2982028 RepID=A0A9D7SY72_9BACT|nr:acyl-CoA reductase [Candidatus Opimibacter skivensis]
MISRDLFLKSLQPLQQYLKSGDAELEHAIEKGYANNPWFFPDFTRHAIHAIADEFLDEVKCARWMDLYPKANQTGKNIAIIMAGNVPIVGFHDLFCVLASGNKAMIKLSDKDSVLPKFIVNKWIEFYPELSSCITFTEKLEGFDAVIATGSNNSSRYFEYYFKSYPHILRKNRNGVAVLTGEETSAELKELGKDIFLYYGLGCRNVSKMYVPEGYDFAEMEMAFEGWNFLADHNKYRNNLDYNYAIYIINNVPHINLGHLILKEDDAIASRIGCVHYSYYNTEKELIENLELKRNEIQCLVKCDKLKGWECVSPGNTQYPTLGQYADGVDTMLFLTSL